jgi:hypothetical protein
MLNAPNLHLAFRIWHSAFGIPHLAFRIWHSAFGILHFIPRFFAAMILPCG